MLTGSMVSLGASTTSPPAVCDSFPLSVDGEGASLDSASSSQDVG